MSEKEKLFQELNDKMEKHLGIKDKLKKEKSYSYNEWIKYIKKQLDKYKTKIK